MEKGGFMKGYGTTNHGNHGEKRIIKWIWINIQLWWKDTKNKKYNPMINISTINSILTRENKLEML